MDDHSLSARSAMLSYRPFRNTDPPVITELWRSCVGQSGLLAEVSADLFEQMIFGKVHFDCAGLIIARDDDRPVGFAHAGFGPNEEQNRISTELGVTCLVLVRPDCNRAEVAAGLLEHCEAYLRQNGAKVLYGGGIQPLNPFYLGLYGGSELPGVLLSDQLGRELYGSHGYKEIERTLILRREMAGFQAVIDRQQMQIRRRMVVEVTVDPPSRNWWEACTLGDFDLTRLDLVPRGGGPAVAHATFRTMHPADAAGFGRAAGLIEFHVQESFRRRGLAVFLLSEAFRQFIRQGVTLVEAQVMEHNTAGQAVYRKLGFAEVDQGSVFRKEGGR